jgi:hypothetical protein
MDKWPIQFWASMLALMGASLTVAVYVIPGTEPSKQVAFQIANSLVSGAIGAFVGHAVASSNQKGMIINNPPDIMAQPKSEDTKSV